MEEDKIVNVTNVMMMKKEKESISTFKNTNTNIRNINNNNDNKNNVILKCFNIGNNNNNNIIPLSNNEYQEYAFLQVQSVHNYSKASRLGTGPGARCNEKSSMNSISGCRQYKKNNENDDDNDNEDYDDECNFNVNENQKILKKEMKKYVVNNDYDDDDDDDDEDEDDTISRKNATNVPDCGESNNDEVEKLTPDHHTRRPMNAFLIFCKRHRAIVRDKYKNLENRSITKILGDWWATLNTEEKACYTSLAKQYKDAFFSANPNFKWYKLPAPPLRTLNTRPGNVGRSTITATTTTTDLFNHSDTDDKNSISNENLEINSPTPTDRSSTPTIIHDKSYEEENYTEEGSSFEDEHHQENYSNVGIFKLADETQMGELNSLIKNERQQQQQQSNDKMNSSIKHLLVVNNSSNTEEENLKKKEYMIMNDSPSKNKSANVYEPLSTNDSLFKEPIKDCITTNKEVENKNYPGKRKAFINDDAAANEYDETQNFSSKRKSVRTCKGKKYQEFRCSAQIMPSFVKKQQPKLKPKSSSSSSLSSSWSFKYDDDNDERAAEAADNNCDCNYYSSFSTLTAKKMQIEFKLNDETNNSIENNQFNSNNNIKQSTVKQQQQQFYNFDFDLEEKIKSLPIQNLDNYLQRKRDTKKKKKFNSKKQNLKCFENTETKTTKTTATNNNNNISVSNNNTVIDYNNVSNNKKVSLLNDQEENRNNQFQQISKTTTVVVGSQKRKARKESITRRDINPNVMNVIGSQAQQDQHQKSPPSQSSLLKLNIMQSIFDTNSEILSESKSKSISQIQQQSESDDNIIKLNHNDTITTDSMPMDSYTNLHSLNILAEVAANHIGDEKT